MIQSLARQPLYLAGVLGILAGILVAQQIASTSAIAADPPAAAPATPKGGITFLDSRPDAVAPAPTSAAPAVQGAPGSGGFARVAMMMLVLVGGVGAWFVMRRRQLGKKGPAAKALSLVGTVKVAGRWQVALVKVPGKTLVLGATDKGLSLLSELDEDVALEAEARDDLTSRVRDDDTILISRDADPRGPRERHTTDPLGALLSRPGPRPPSPSTRTQPDAPLPPREAFGDLLDQLTGSTRATTAPSAPGVMAGPGAHRERLKTDEAQALRARLERHQTH